MLPLRSSSSSTTSSPSLSQRINTATRATHTHLNALIISLLPLALPPHNSDPTIYARGIEHILPIYKAFEGAFRLLLLRQDFGQKAVGERMSRMHIPRLERTERLSADLGSILRGVKEHQRQGRESRPEVADIDCKGGEKLQRPSHLAIFASCIHDSVYKKPHLLLAYTWLLYMALFSGGRYIRQKLQQAGPGFWDSAEYRDGSVRLGEKGEERVVDDFLSFWTFEGEEDGEDIKADFKRQFQDVEMALTGLEKDEVVQEAVFIMQSIIRMVKEIAEDVGGEHARSCQKQLARMSGEDDRHGRLEIQRTDELSMHWLLLKHVLPMGMAELIAGAGRALAIGMESCLGSTVGGRVKGE